MEFNSRCKALDFHTENFSSFYALSMNWNDRLVELLSAKGWNPPDLARALEPTDADARASLLERIYKYAKPSDKVTKPVPVPRGNLMERMATALDSTEPYLRLGITKSSPEPNARIGEQIPHTRGRTPIFGHGAGGTDGRFILNGQRLADILTPPSLEGVKDAYAVYIHGDSMVPRYYTGEVGHVNPHRPVRREDFVVAQIMNADGELEGYVKQFVSHNEKELILEQFNPPKKLRFPAKLVHAVHKIVGSGEG